jgi:DNA replication protein DnaC
VIQQGYRVLYREAHILLEELADATLDGQRKEHMEMLSTVPLLIIDDLGMRKTAPHRRRGVAGNHHAPLRTSQLTYHFQQAR